VDNDGDADSDLTFEFKFKTNYKGLSVNANGVKTAIPLVQTGQIDAANSNVQQSYTITLVRHGHREAVRNATLGGDVFFKPVDNIGNKTIPDYEGYAENFSYEVGISGCNAPGRVFVGQRKGIRGQSWRSIRPGQHQPGESTRWRAEHDI
jgi:hypothetical protein